MANDSEDFRKPAPRSHKNKDIIHARGSRKDILQKCEAAGIDIIDGLIGFAKNDRDVQRQFSAYCELADRTYPKLKAIEHTGEVDLGVYEKMAEEAMARLLKAKSV